jgi:hypothetical protein
MNLEQEAQFEAAINARINAAVAAAMVARSPPPQQPPAAVSAVAVKLPEFWTSDPIMWFRQARLASAALTSPPAAPCTIMC